MKLHHSILLPLLVIAFISCGSSGKSEQKTETVQVRPEGWEDRPYEISELIIMFQDWVPDSCLSGKYVWLSMGTEWEKFKQTDHTKIQYGQYNIIKNDSSMTPALYLATIAATIEDRSFFTPAWFKNANNWLEAMVVSYSDAKCADQTIVLVEKYINQDKLKPEFKVYKEIWIKELNRISTETEK